MIRVDMEHKSLPVATRAVFINRLVRSVTLATISLTICLLIGIAGYHYLADINWIDSIHNASMILSGMGPVADIKNTSGKLFSSAYALFSGVAFITNIGILLGPIVHRILHKIHCDIPESED